MFVYEFGALYANFEDAKMAVVEATRQDWKKYDGWLAEWVPNREEESLRELNETIAEIMTWNESNGNTDRWTGNVRWTSGDFYILKHEIITGK